MWKEVASVLSEDLARDGEALILFGDFDPQREDLAIADCSPSTLKTKETPSAREIRKYLWVVRVALADLGDAGGIWGSLEDGSYEVGICRVGPVPVEEPVEEVQPHA